jgi:hypothetical protein
LCGWRATARGGRLAGFALAADFFWRSASVAFGKYLYYRRQAANSRIKSSLNYRINSLKSL